ncbi:vacuolar amino acid permease [Lentinus tigrinus ALCF2SS1-7]|uniref:Vacuolar amino acid permease n=1 Tax=Lentinus tigrinus ALCF2SS1-6 TaxID=1328759 RepID=A0A5C2SFI4_9APHY|nr:vacuolar amino acid permease [Lentinus tigrinus ALCF2SS1-6]RPD74416.1 vacuolar amino acid permease [Lentinus tigrinus ALCF2SS1-7]
MPPSFRESEPDETRPLLGNDRADAASYTSSSSGTQRSLASASASEPPALNKISRTDLAWVLAGLWSAVFLGALDGTIVATLLSPIGSYFNESNRSSYIGTSYLLSVCCFTPLYGRLSDILGRKGAMLLALSFFGSGTLLCGLAPSMDALIAARALAGMGGGGVMTVSSVAVTDLIPLRQRGLYQGMTNILFGLGAGLGGPLGGWMNDALGWRSAFLLQMPILVFSYILVALKVSIKLPDEVESQPLHAKLRRIDVLGSFTLVGTVGCLLLGLSLKSTEELPWTHPVVWGLLLASVVFAVLFIWVETRYAPYPVMPMRLIKQRTPLFVSLSNFFGSVAAFSMIYNVPLYFSAVRLNSSTDAGLHLLPHSVAISTGSVFAGWVMRRTGRLYNLTLFSCLLTVLAATLVAMWNESSAAFHLWLDVAPQGFGMASVITTTLIAMIASVTREDIAVATGITYLFRTTGQVIGVSLSGALLQTVLTAKLRERIHGPDAVSVHSDSTHARAYRHSTTIIPTLAPELRQAAVDSYADALHVVFICQAVINFMCFLCCLPIQENPLPCVSQRVSLPRARS